ncbi:MAG TPA: alpha/beta family hydrolase [Dehalococcoidia bacterium]|nr:alpha/beta family hydrolase [Dehalococcoidia bacterium]
MSEREVRIEVGEGRSVTALVAEPEKPGDITLLYAPGAGSNVHDAFGKYLCRESAERGVTAVRFQFLYQEVGRRSPDRPDVLEATWRAVVANFAGKRLVVGGRSMGGRIASQVVAGGAEVAGLALFAYPLHPPGKADARRVAHLPQITVPVLFCSGTNDAFGSPEELREAASLAPKSSLHLIQGADHGFAARKASGRTKEDVYAEAFAAFWEWLKAIG